METGSHTGGSALFFAHACDRAGTGHVITVDVATDHLRRVHPRITQFHGSSIAPEIFEQIRQHVSGGRVMVVLDSDHTQAHVAREIELYSTLVSPGDHLVVEDVNINGHPVYDDFGPGPWEAVQAFLATAPPFTPDPTCEKYYVTFHAWLRRTSV